MDLQQLRAIGAFKDRSLFKREITVKHFPLLPEADWPDASVPAYSSESVESSFDVFVRKRSSADALELSRVERRLAAHYDIFRNVLNAKGEQVFPTIEDVLALEEWMLFPLFDAVCAVNPVGPKASPPKTKPGATSRSPSGEKRSRSGKRFSRLKSGDSGSNTGARTER